MDGSDVGDDADFGLGEIGEISDFAESEHAHFQDRRQGERHGGKIVDRRLALPRPGKRRNVAIYIEQGAVGSGRVGHRIDQGRNSTDGNAIVTAAKYRGAGTARQSC